MLHSTLQASIKLHIFIVVLQVFLVQTIPTRQHTRQQESESMLKLSLERKFCGWETINIETPDGEAITCDLEPFRPGDDDPVNRIRMRWTAPHGTTFRNTQSYAEKTHTKQTFDIKKKTSGWDNVFIETPKYWLFSIYIDSTSQKYIRIKIAASRDIKIWRT